MNLVSGYTVEPQSDRNPSVLILCYVLKRSEEYVRSKILSSMFVSKSAEDVLNDDTVMQAIQFCKSDSVCFGSFHKVSLLVCNGKTVCCCAYLHLILFINDLSASSRVKAELIVKAITSEEGSQILKNAKSKATCQDMMTW